MSEVQDGDHTSYETLVRRYQDDALRLAYYYLHNWEDAKDISQDAFIKVLVKADQFNPEQPFKPWFFRILINHCINFRNRKRKVKFLSIFQPTGEQSNGSLLDQVAGEEDGGEEYQTRQLVWSALSKLSSSHRDVLVLHEMQGFKENEISEILNCSVGTVKSRLHYSKKKMRKILSEELRQKE